MIRGDDEQRVRMCVGEVHTDLDRAIEGDRLSDLRTGIGSLILLVNRRALDLQEKPWTGWAMEQLDTLRRHVCQRWLAERTVILPAGLRLVYVRRIRQRLIAGPLGGHVAGREQA